MRELTILGSQTNHPEFLEGGILQRVDHPTVRPLAEGDATLGWEGDPRLVIYLSLPESRFILYRMENDGVYRGIALLPVGSEITPQSMNKLIQKLIATDQRRGYDAFQDVLDAQERDRNTLRDLQRQQVEDVGDKLHYALSRAHLPGVDITRIRNVPTPMSQPAKPVELPASVIVR